MPLPPALKSLVQSRRFWTDFLWESEVQDGSYVDLERCRVHFPIGGGYRLSLTIDQHLEYFSLTFISPDEAPVEIAWDGQAHPTPHVLRWEELEMLCRAIALQAPDLPHPGVPLLLLHRFAPICDGDDLDLIVPMLESAWDQTGAFSGKEIADLIERADVRGAGFEWQFDEVVRGWCLKQEDHWHTSRVLYTLRHSENTDFSFQAWQCMLGQAQCTTERMRGVAQGWADAFARTGDLALGPVHE